MLMALFTLPAPKKLYKKPRLKSKKAYIQKTEHNDRAFYVRIERD
jgi:hypothetical protein